MGEMAEQKSIAGAKENLTDSRTLKMSEETIKGNLSETIEEAVEIAEEVVQHPYTKLLARLGFYTKGFLYIVIGLLAILVAVGSRDGKLAAPAGALASISQAPFGKILLIIFIVGAIGHGIWNILRGLADVDNAGGGFRGIIKRIVAVCIGIFYLILALSAWNIIVTAEVLYDDATIPKTLTAILLALPFGVGFVALIGLITIGIGIHECYQGISGKYKENYRIYKIEHKHRRIITGLGVFSFTARALIFILIGYFFVSAAVNFNADQAIGLDGALLALAQSYYGKSVLFVTAAGLVCHGVLSLYEAHYRRIC
jgi:hypothetical protein